VGGEVDVFTLRDPGAGEQLPHWSGRPVTADWYYPEPENLSGETWERRKMLTGILRGLEGQWSIHGFDNPVRVGWSATRTEPAQSA
jgi:hypothetical protein